MYQDLIRNELNEAAETLANFLQDEIGRASCRERV